MYPTPDATTSSTYCIMTAQLSYDKDVADGAVLTDLNYESPSVDVWNEAYTITSLWGFFLCVSLPLSYTAFPVHESTKVKNKKTYN